jgi:hypothetical protein
MSAVETQKQDRPPVELLVPTDENGQIDPITEVSWCIDPAFHKRITEDPTISHPHLLLLVCITDKVVERHLVPLDKQPLRMVFNGSGKNVLRATVVWPRRDQGPVELWKTFFDPEYQGYVKDPLELFRKGPDYYDRIWSNEGSDVPVRITGEPEAGPDGKTYWAIEGSATRIPEDQLRSAEPTTHYAMRDEFRGCRRHKLEDEVVVDIDANLFASDPPKLLKELVEFYPWWKTTGARDQCSFRRRAMMALPLSLCLSPFALIFAIVVAICAVGYMLLLIGAAGFLNLCGVRGINYGTITSPFEYDNPRFLWRDITNSRWYFNAEDEPTSRILQAVNPLTYVVSGVLLWLVSTLSGWFPLGLVLLVTLPIAICIVLGVVLPIVWKPLEAKLESWIERHQADSKLRAKQEDQEYTQRLATFVCNGNGAPLPQDRSVRMRLSKLGYEIKDRVCKPYAQYRG